MATIINPKVVIPASPVNLDMYIYQMQGAFAEGLPWLEKAFGRSWKMFRQDSGAGKSKGVPRGYAFPGVYSGGKEYFNCLPNDTLKSYCFFSVRDTGEPVATNGNQPYVPGVYNDWKQPVDIIFWWNGDKTSPGFDYPLTENYLANIRKVLRFIPWFLITGVQYNPDNVFNEYSLDHVAEQYLSQPFGGVKIMGEINFLEQDVFGECSPF